MQVSPKDIPVTNVGTEASRGKVSSSGLTVTERLRDAAMAPSTVLEQRHSGETEARTKFTAGAGRDRGCAR